MRVEATIPRRARLAFSRYRIAKVKADPAEPIMCLGILGIGSDRITQVDLRRAQIALLNRLACIGEIVGVRGHRQHAEPNRG
jgi:hypothetical protein